MFKVLSFLYNYFDMFPERECNLLRRWILKNHFFKLFLHWSCVGQEFFVNLMIFRLLRGRNWISKENFLQKTPDKRSIKISPSVRRLKEHASSSLNAAIYMDEMSEDKICLNTVLKAMIVDDEVSIPMVDDRSMCKIKRSNALKWFVKHVQSVATEQDANNLFETMVDSGMFILLNENGGDSYATMGTSLFFEKSDALRTTFEVEADVKLNINADSNASIDKAGTVLFEIRRMFNAALRHIRRELKKYEKKKNSDSRFVNRLCEESVTIENAIASSIKIEQNVSSVTHKITEENRKKDIETALMGVSKKMNTIMIDAKSSIDSIRVSSRIESEQADLLRLTENADRKVVSQMIGWKCPETTGSEGSLKYARSALKILEKKLIQFDKVRSRLERGIRVEIPGVYWNIKVHDESGKVVAHDSV
tara:strand:- start:619 stop:1881 length:1263 start_codon:yes stop_codon:yes gene_type:complete